MEAVHGGVKGTMTAFYLPPYILLPSSKHFSRIFLKSFFRVCKRCPEDGGLRPMCVSPLIVITSDIEHFFAHFAENFFRAQKRRPYEVCCSRCEVSPLIVITSGMKRFFARGYQSNFSDAAL